MAAVTSDAKALGRKERRAMKEASRVAELQPLQEKLSSNDADLQLEAARELRQMLEGSHPVHIDDVIHAGLVPRLLELSRDSKKHELEFELLWALERLTQGTAEQTADVVDRDAVEILKGLVGSADASVREQSLNILANVAEASIELRDMVIASKATSAAIKMLSADQETEHVSYYDEAEKLWKLRCGQPEQPLAIIRMAARCFKSVCQGEPRPNFGDEMKALLHILEMMVMSTDEVVLAKACGALSHLHYGAADNLETVVRDGVCGRLVELLSHKAQEVQCVAARAAEQIATGSARGMEAILQCKPLPALKAMLASKEAAIQRDSCSVVADVLALGGPHVQEVIDAGCLPLCAGLVHSEDEEVRRSSARAVAAFSSQATPEQVDAFVDARCVAGMVKILESTAFQSSADVGRAALNFIENVLQAGRQLQQQKSLSENPFAKMIKDADGLRMLQAVTEMSDKGDVCAKAKAILQSGI